MLRVPVNRIKAGMVLARPLTLTERNRQLRLRRNQPIPTDVVPYLSKLGVREVWVRHPKLEFLESAVDEELAERHRDLCRQVRIHFEQVMEGTYLEMDFAEFCRSIGEMFSYLKRNPHGLQLLEKVGDYDNYLVDHSANVCYLALALGIHLETYIKAQLPEHRPDEGTYLQLLGLGCLLHDVGKTKVPPEILNKPSRLTKDEMELVKQHPVHGYEMLRGLVPPLVADVVLNHHQRWNGEGYPERYDRRTGESLGGLVGRQISIFSRIATVADVYDAATSSRCYSGAKPSVQVHYEMQTACRGFFDPRVHAALRQIVPAFPLGQVVTLSDGAEAVVVDFDARHPLQPKVNLLCSASGRTMTDPSEHELDLAHCDDLEIVRAGDVDVTPYVSALSPALQLAGNAALALQVPQPA